MMQQRMRQFMMGDMADQASMVSDAKMQMAAQEQAQMPAEEIA